MEDREGGGGVAPVDGVGQLPRGYPARFAEEGRHLLDAQAGAGAVGHGQHLEERAQPAQVVAQVAAGQVDGGGVEPHRPLLDPGRQPRRAVATSGHAGVDHVADLAHRVDHRAGELAPAGDQHQAGGIQGVGQVGDEGGHVGGEEPAHVPGHDNPMGTEEGRGLSGVDDGGDLVLPAQVLDDEPGIVVPRQFGDKGVHRVSDQGGVVAFHQVGGEDGRVGAGHRGRLTGRPRGWRRWCGTPGECP